MVGQIGNPCRNYGERKMTTTKTIIAAALLGTAFLGAVYNNAPSQAQPLASLPDYSNASRYACDSVSIDPDLSDVIIGSENGHTGLRLIYTNNVSEISRSNDELKCGLTAVTTRTTQKLEVRWFNQDGHSLFGVHPLN
jgi:hypothetical protein